MATILLSLPIVLITVAGLAIGVLLKGPPLRGSCGGENKDGAGCACQRHERVEPT